MAGTDDIGLLLVPPRADTVADQGDPIVISMGAKLLGGEGMDGARLNTNAALVDGAAVNVTHHTVGALLLCRGGPQNDRARLVARIAAVIRHVVIANDVTGLEDGITLPAVRHRIAAGVENAVHPLRPAPQATLDQAAMHVPFRLTGAHRGEDFQIGVIQE